MTLFIDCLSDGRTILSTYGMPFYVFASVADCAQFLRETADNFERCWADAQKERANATTDEVSK